MSSGCGNLSVLTSVAQISCTSRGQLRFPQCLSCRLHAAAAKPELRGRVSDAAEVFRWCLENLAGAGMGLWHPTTCTVEVSDVLAVLGRN